MDPTANLAEQRRLAALAEEGLESLTPAEVGRLAELVRALDHWLTTGGFLPHDWRPVVAFERQMAAQRAAQQVRPCPLETPNGHRPHRWALTTAGSGTVDYYTCPGSPAQQPAPVTPHPRGL